MNTAAMKTADEALKFCAVFSLMTLALIAPPFSYVIWPYYRETYRRERIVRVEYDHDYFGAI